MSRADGRVRRWLGHRNAIPVLLGVGVILLAFLQRPGELVVDEGKSVSLVKQEGVFNRREPDAEAEARFQALLKHKP